MPTGVQHSKKLEQPIYVTSHASFTWYTSTMKMYQPYIKIDHGHIIEREIDCKDRNKEQKIHIHTLFSDRLTC